MPPVICQEILNGVLIPAINLGTYRITSKTAGPVVDAAISSGYRGFDCARFYQNEDIIGPLIGAYESGEKSLSVASEVGDFAQIPDGFKRVDDFDATFSVPHGPCKNRLFVTTKIWPTDFDKDISELLKVHLSNFKREVADLVLLHWPGVRANWGYTLEQQTNAEANFRSRLGVWQQLEKLYHRKLIRAIGVSNFMQRHLEPLMENIKQRKANGDPYATPIMINQVEGSAWIHGFAPIYDLCRENRIAISAYRPLGGDSVKYGKILEGDISSELSRKYRVEKANVLIRWLLQKGCIVLPKSATPSRIRSNMNVFSFALTDADMSELDKLKVSDFNISENPNEIA